MFQENNICLSYKIITIGRGERKRGDLGLRERESMVVENKSPVEECEMFTIAGLHKEKRNRGGKPESSAKPWMVLSKHTGLLQGCPSITPLPVR